MKKTILVLANSIKKKYRCVAGREVITARGGYQLGDWVRPISDHDEGALKISECMLTNGKMAEVFDCVNIPLRHKCDDLCQPENWKIAEDYNWESVNSVCHNIEVSQMLEEPDGLWLGTCKKTDRISHVDLSVIKPEQSLFIIKPENLVIKFYKEYNKYEDYYQNRKIACFTYQGVKYCLSITDPEFTRIHCPQMPRDSEKPIIVDFSITRRCLLCISLTGLHDKTNYHYKVVATIFENAI